MPVTLQLLAPLAAQGRMQGTQTLVPVQVPVLGQLCLQKKTGPFCALCVAPRSTFSLPAPPALWLSAASCCHASEEQQTSMNWHEAGTGSRWLQVLLVPGLTACPDCAKTMAPPQPQPLL